MTVSHLYALVQVVSSAWQTLIISHHDLSTYYTQDPARVSALPQRLICKKYSVYICWMDG